MTPGSAAHIAGVTTTRAKSPAKRARKPRPPRWPLAWDGDRLVTTTDEATAAVDRARLSASTAKAVNSCPARMVADRLMRGPEDPLDPAPIGTAAHTVLERLFSLPAAQRTPDRDRVAAGRADAGAGVPGHPAPVAGDRAGSIGRWRTEVGERVAGIFELEDPRQVLVRRTEWPLDTVEVAGVPFTGFIDRADIVGDGERFGCRIVDFKSGKYKGVAPFGDDHGDQLRVYAEAVRVADGRMPIAADLLYIGARRARSVSLSRREMSATLEGFARAWVDLKHHVAERAFPATPSPLCGWCPLVNACPAAARDGRAARVEGLPSAAELGHPGAAPARDAGVRDRTRSDGEPRVIPAADVAGYDPADTPEPPADTDFRASSRRRGDGRCRTHGSAGAGRPAGHQDNSDNGGAAMTSLLREDKPWEQTAGPDGRLNPNSYSATAVFGIVEMAVELLHQAGVHAAAVGGDRAVPHPGARRARRAARPGRQQVLPGRGEHPAPRGAAHHGGHDAAAVRRGRAGLVRLGGPGDPAHRLHREGGGGPVRQRPGRPAVAGPGGPGPSRHRPSRNRRPRGRLHAVS